MKWKKRFYGWGACSAMFAIAGAIGQNWAYILISIAMIAATKWALNNLNKAEDDASS